MCHPSPLAESSAEYHVKSASGRSKDIKADSSSFRSSSADHLGHVTGTGSTKAAATWNSGPSFDAEMVRNITAIDGRDVQLPCKVYNLGNRTVIKEENQAFPKKTQQN